MRADSAAFAQKNVASAKAPRYVIELAFDAANTILRYFTSHTDAALPGGASAFTRVVEGLAGTSQTLKPDTANATIGSISFDVVDKDSVITTALGAQLALGHSTRRQRVRVYVGFEGLAWADYTLVQTQLVSEIVYKEGAYSFKCADVQREMRQDIFDVAKTTLASTVLAADTTINVFDTSAFTAVEHGTSYSDAPGATVGYIRIDDEVIRYAGKTSTTFTGCARGALNTLAVDHTVDATLATDRRTQVTEYVYLELPAVKLIYALLTGILYKPDDGALVVGSPTSFIGEGLVGAGAATLPDAWHLGIPASYVRLADFIDPAKKDLWDPADDQQGFVARLEDLEKKDGKKFIETELALLTGTFMPVYASGELGLRRMANVLAGAAYGVTLDDTNVVSWGALTHDFTAMHNILRIDWNWDPLKKAFTRITELVDAASIATHKKSDPLNLKFRALHGSRHSAATLAQRFDSLRDRYTGPPQLLAPQSVPSLNGLEVGDVVRGRTSKVRDFVLGGTLDRSFEVQNAAMNWVTGALGLKLFASSQAPGAQASSADTTVLTAGWYTGTGTLLSSVLTITGSGPGHVSAGGTLTGTSDLNAPASIFYYDGDLQIDVGITINIVGNVQLRIRGHLQNNGKINGKGAGLAGAAALVSAASYSDYNLGTVGFLGSTEAGGGIRAEHGFRSIRGGVVTGANSTIPAFTLSWDGIVLRGIPTDLRGSSGSSGMPAATFKGNEESSEPDPFGYALTPGGGPGGPSGAGLAIVCKGFSQGVAGVIDLSGGDGAPGLPDDNTPWVNFLYSGSAAGGAPGALLVLLDGALVTATDLTEAGFVALNGKTPIIGTPESAPFVGFTPNVAHPRLYSYFTGTGDGTTFPLPSLSGARGGARVQFVPANVAAAPDASAPAANVTEFTAKQQGNVVVFQWAQVADTELKGYDIGFAAQGETDWNLFAPLTEAARGTEMTNANVPPGSWTFGIRARNLADVLSLVTAYADAVVINTQPIVSQAKQEPDWIGVVVNFVRHCTGVLVPLGTKTSDQYGWEVFDLFVPDPVASASYTAPQVDTGLDDTLRVFATQDFNFGPGQTGLITSDFLIDTWLTAGSDLGVFVSWIVGSLRMRYLRARLEMNGIVAGAVSYVTDFTPTADRSPLIEHSEVVVVAAGGTAIIFPTPFHLTPNVQVTTVSAGLTSASATDVTTTGCTLHAWNGTTDAGGVVNWQATGD